MASRSLGKTVTSCKVNNVHGNRVARVASLPHTVSRSRVPAVVDLRGKNKLQTSVTKRLPIQCVLANRSPTQSGPHEDDQPMRKPPFIIGVAGGTASGKTSICKIIEERLHRDISPPESVVSITQDRFYRNLTQEERDNVKEHNFDHPSAFDFDMTFDTLVKLKLRLPVQVPTYDFRTSSRLPDWEIIDGAEVIIFEGILALYDQKMRDLFDMKIFVDTDADTRLARRLRRDITDRGRNPNAVLDQYESTVKPSFDQFILPTKQYADVIIPRGAENTVAIDLISQHLRYKLSEVASVDVCQAC